MKPIEFPEVNVRIAEHQKEFQTLPVYHNEKDGSITFCCKISDDELNRIKATNEIWIKLFTGGTSNIPPILLSTNKEDMIFDFEKPIDEKVFELIKGKPSLFTTEILNEYNSKFDKVSQQDIEESVQRLKEGGFIILKEIK